jgi:chemotaxis protein CheC
MPNPDQVDALKELINVGVGRAAGMLNQLVNTHIQLQVPDVTVLTMEEYSEKLEEIISEKLAIVRLGFEGAFSGVAELVFPEESAINLVAVLSDEEPGTPDLDAAKTDALTEVGNIVLNSVMGSFANILNERLSFHLPVYSNDAGDVLRGPDRDIARDKIIIAQVHFTIRKLETVGDIILLFEMGSFDALLSHVDKFMDELKV